MVWVLAAEAEAEQDEWVLRMIGMFYSPRSSSARTYDAIVTRNEDAWVLDRLITQVIWE